MPLFPTDYECNVKFLPDDAFRVACVVISQAATPVYPTNGRGAKLTNCGAV